MINKGPKSSEWIYEVIVSPKMWNKYCKKSLKRLVHILEETMTS